MCISSPNLIQPHRQWLQCLGESFGAPDGHCSYGDETSQVSLSYFPSCKGGRMSSEIIPAQRKRALEALERRFSASKPDVKKVQKRKKESVKKKEEGEEDDGERGTEAASTSAASKKGKFEFQGKFGTAGVSELVHPAYKELSLSVHQNLIKPPAENPSTGAAVVNNIIHNLLQKGDSAEKYMQGSRSMKIDNWILLDNHVAQSNGLDDARVKAIRCRSNRSKSRMSMRQHRALGSLELPQRFWKFDLFKPMHEMWKEYILKVLDERWKHMGQVFLAADLHGAFLQVVDCKGGTFTGARGIMIRETKETFAIITPDDQFRVVPKKLCVFQLQAASFKVTLFGDKLSSRNIC